MFNTTQLFGFVILVLGVLIYNELLNVGLFRFLYTKNDFKISYKLNQALLNYDGRASSSLKIDNDFFFEGKLKESEVNDSTSIVAY